MDTDHLKSTLENAGLSQYQAEAYVTLLELGTASAVELSKASQVPQARIYDVLRSLDDRGYVETFEKGSLHARAHDLEMVIEDLQHHAQAALDAAEEIEGRWKQPAVENHHVSVVNRFETVQRWAREYIEAAEVEIQLAATVDQFRDLADVLETAKARGIIIELVVFTATDGEELPDFESELPGRVTEARVRRFPSPFLLLADRTNVCFAPDIVFHPVNEYGIVMDDYSLGHVFEQYFQTVLWENRPVLYLEDESKAAVTYTRVRQCIRDILPAFEDGATIRLSVEGLDRLGEEITLTGTVADIVYSGPTATDDTGGYRRFVDQATLVVETADGTYEIGGFGAIIEDVEAKRISIEDIDR